MEYKQQTPAPRTAPRLIIHGGAGNVTPATVPPEKYTLYREALLTIASHMSLATLVDPRLTTSRSPRRMAT